MTATLLSDIEAFLLRCSIAPSTFGAMVSDRHLVRQLRQGRRVWPETEGRIRAKMNEIEGVQTPVAKPEARTVTCIACDRRLDDDALRACTDSDCPNADREAA